jgi:DNA-3-methyladenine glycosylase I
VKEDLVVGEDGRARCWWCGADPLYVRYHDDEWGRPTTDEQELFELLCLEAFQAGLAWITILRKREGFRAAFGGFDVDTVAGYGEPEIERLLGDTGIVRHRGKIEAAIGIAALCRSLAREGTSLAELVWSYVPATRPRPRASGDIPVHVPEAVALSSELRARGAKFVGPTVVYAFMQSAGVVDDHLVGCHAGG